MKELPINNNHLSIINNKGCVFSAICGVNLGNFYLSNQCKSVKSVVENRLVRHSFSEGRSIKND